MDTKHLLQLEENLKKREQDLLQQLRSLGIESPDGEFTARVEDLGRTEEDTRMEDELFEEAQPLVNELRNELQQIRESLRKIKDNNYGN